MCLKIYIKLTIKVKLYSLQINIMVEVEEEEEVGCYMAKKEEAHMYHHSMMPCS